MKSIILLAWLSVVFLPCSYCQFSFPMNTGDCVAGRLVDPFLVSAVKTKYPKKYGSRLAYGKDLGIDAKYRLGTAKLLARHMKSLNAVNQDLQNLLYQKQQSLMMQPGTLSDQSSSLGQPQVFTNFPLSYDASRSILVSPLIDGPYPQATDQRFQQTSCPLAGTQSLTSLRPQQSVFQPGVSMHL